MQAKERRSPNVTQTTLLRPPEESDRVLQALVQMATRIGKPFSEQRMQQFHDDLISYPVQAIEYFCDCWGRSAKVLPALSDALALVQTWYADHSEPTNCDCSHLHGRGYGTNDLMWLMNQRGKSAESFSISQWEELMARLDAKREGGAPNWRTTPEGQMFLRGEVRQ